MPDPFELTNRKLELKLCAVFLFISVVLGYIGWSSYGELKKYQLAEEKVLAINEQLRSLNRFMVAMVDAETGQRGYLLTDQVKYLDSYNSGLGQVNAELRQVHAQLNKDLGVIPVLEEINTLKAGKLEVMAKTIALHKAGDAAGAKRLFLNGSGKEAMDQIRERVNGLLAAKRMEAEEIKRFIAVQAERTYRILKVFIALIILCMMAGYSIIFHDLTARRRLKQALACAHNYDALTGLVNRRYFSQVTADHLKHALRDNTAVAILVVDLDNFSAINTRYGYAAGDRLLKDIGARLKEMGRKEDVIARLDGDEFAILVSPVGDVDELRLLAGRIIQALNPALIPTMREQYIGASIGIAMYPVDTRDSEKLLLNAKIAASNAKAEGKQHYRFFDSQISLLLTRVEKITHALQGALSRNEFSIHYQPQLDLKTKKSLG